MSKTEKTVKDIRRNTRRKFSTKEKIRIVLDGLWGESVDGDYLIAFAVTHRRLVDRI